MKTWPLLFITACLLQTSLSYTPSGYLGCYTDRGDRIVSGRLSNSNTNTGDECKRRCKAAGYRYAGTEYTVECFCGNYIKDYPKGTGCTARCPGNSNEFCGGTWHISMYDTWVVACSDGPCKNGAGCTNVGNSYSCSCTAGWTGTNCDQDVNECASNPCKNGAVCTNGRNRYTCSCAAGWTSTNCDVDVNECASSPCKNGAVCINGQNRYTCSCAAGWTSTNCDVDVNECASNPCQNGATCNNNQNHYTCTCAAGWQGYNCDQDINECLSEPCFNGATCNNLLNQYTCTCAGGWQGYNCDQDIDECASNPCQNGATCNNYLNYYTCDCTAGWEGYDCDQDIDECASNPCFNGATCNNLQNHYTCDCAGGWQGYNCDTDIDECLSSPCVNGTCTNLQNAYMCTCFPEYTARNCDYLIGSPMDGNWGLWEAWQGCSVTCGTGRQRRYRACDDPKPDYGGLPCSGDSFEESACNGGSACPVPVDGNWGAWSGIAPCSKTCGQGKAARSRQCDNPPPSNGGSDCTGDSIVLEVCVVANCTSDDSASSSYVNVCPSGYFTCFSGSITCIQEVFKCDCAADCDDGSDEIELWAGCPQQCSEASGLKSIPVSVALAVICVLAFFNINIL